MNDVDPVPEPHSPRFEPDSRRKGPFKGWGFSIVAGLALLLVLANAFIELPYFVLGPGETVAVEQFVELPADKANPPEGELMLTTVSVLRAHPFDIVWAWLTEGTEIEKKREVLGDQTPQQFNQENADLMNSSQMAAISVAMRKAGYTVTVLGDGATIMQVGPQTPSEGKLNAGEVITAVDGSRVGIASDVTTLVRQKKVGDTVKVSLVDANGVPREVDIVTAGLPTDANVPYLGVVVQTKNARLETPFPVSFKTTDIGGPSAGLVFTLTLLDELTPGELTGGGKVAVTGTIESDGQVGPVGGVEQKTISVRKAGAKLFIVPSSEVNEAKKFAGSKMKVVGVDTLDQAVDALGANGGEIGPIKALSAAPAT